MIPAAGVRIRWSDLPPHVHAAVAGILGAPIVAAHSQPGGFSPGTADRVVTETGERAFVKAVSPDQNTLSADMARAEAVVAAALPPGAPAPELLGTHDDGHWIVLVFADVAGRHPRTPWVEPELAAAARGLTELVRHLTPSPLPGLPQAGDRLADDLGGWQRIAADPPADLPPWLLPHIGELRDRAAAVLRTLTGDTLVHADVRADNMLIRPDGEVVLVDWPWGCNGPPWLDTALLAMNVLVHGGDPGTLRVPPAGEELIIAFAGFFLDCARDPAPPGLPTLRAFQRAQADALLPWMRPRLG